MTLALIDGDEAVFKACTIKVEDDDWEGTGLDTRRLPDLDDAKRTLDSLLKSWTSEAECDGFTVVLSPDDRKLFRRGIFAGYKAGRSEKPPHFWELVEYVRKAHRCTDRPGLEADDTMGILSGHTTCIVSSDKDMGTVPGALYNPGKKLHSFTTTIDADRFWMYQTLMGDRTDGYLGATKIGPKKAEEILESGTSIAQWWPEVVRTYLAPKNKKGEFAQTEAEAVQNAICARILRPGDYADGRIRYRIHNYPVEINVANTSR